MAITLTPLAPCRREERDFSIVVGHNIIEISVAPPRAASVPGRPRLEAWDVAITNLAGNSSFSGLGRESGPKAFDLAVRLFSANAAGMGVQISSSSWQEIKEGLEQRGAFALLEP